MYTLSAETSKKTSLFKSYTEKKYGELLELNIKTSKSVEHQKQIKKQLEQIPYIDFKTIGQKVDFLKRHIATDSYFYGKFIDNEGNEKYFKFAPAKKGNNTYSSRVANRFELIQEYLRTHFIFEKKSDLLINTNILFITLTTETKTFNQIKDSWETMPERVQNLIRQLRKKYGNISYFYVFESHLRGGCHCHLCLILPSAIECKKIIGADGKAKYITRNSVRDYLKDYWKENIDVQGCYAFEGLERYLAKEMSKQGKSVEQALKDFDNGFKDMDKSAIEKDIKQIMTYYYSIRSKTRLLNTSKSIKAEVEQEGNITEKDLDNLVNTPCSNMIKSYQNNKKYHIVDVFLVRTSKFYTVYGGELIPGTEEFKETVEIFNKRSKEIDAVRDIHEQFINLYREAK